MGRAIKYFGYELEQLLEDSIFIDSLISHNKDSELHKIYGKYNPNVGSAYKLIHMLRKTNETLDTKSVIQMWINIYSCQQRIKRRPMHNFNVKVYLATILLKYSILKQYLNNR